jgi:hypothetical protein
MAVEAGVDEESWDAGSDSYSGLDVDAGCWKLDARLIQGCTRPGLPILNSNGINPMPVKSQMINR